MIKTPPQLPNLKDFDLDFRPTAYWDVINLPGETGPRYTQNGYMLGEERDEDEDEGASASTNGLVTSDANQWKNG